MPETLINFDLLKQILGDDKESFESFFELFREQTELDIAEFEKSLSEKNLNEIARLAHKLKSTYGSLGSGGAYETLINMEKSAKENEEFGKIEELFSQFMELHGKILEEFDNYLKT